MRSPSVDSRQGDPATIEKSQERVRAWAKRCREEDDDSSPRRSLYIPDAPKTRLTIELVERYFGQSGREEAVEQRAKKTAPVDPRRAFLIRLNWTSAMDY